MQFAGACRGRSGKVSGEESHRSGTGGNRNTYPNHCTADFHAVSTWVCTSFDEALNTLRGCQYHQTGSINEPRRFIDYRVQGCTKKHATGHGHGHCMSQNYQIFYEVVRRHIWSVLGDFSDEFTAKSHSRWKNMKVIGSEYTGTFLIR